MCRLKCEQRHLTGLHPVHNLLGLVNWDLVMSGMVPVDQHLTAVEDCIQQAFFGVIQFL